MTTAAHRRQTKQLNENSKCVPRWSTSHKYAFIISCTLYEFLLQQPIQTSYNSKWHNFLRKIWLCQACGLLVWKWMRATTLSSAAKPHNLGVFYRPDQPQQEADPHKLSQSSVKTTLHNKGSRTLLYKSCWNCRMWSCLTSRGALISQKQHDHLI